MVTNIGYLDEQFDAQIPSFLIEIQDGHPRTKKIDIKLFY